MPFMLAVSGKKQSGKDTLVRYLNPIINAAGRVEYFSFADQLKKFLIDAMGIDYSSVWGSDEEKNKPTNYFWDKLPYDIRRSNAKPGTYEARTGPMSGREIMQVFGTNIMRELFDDKIWVNACFRDIQSRNPDFALLADMRFPSELSPWVSNNGFIIRLLRDVSNGDSHSSETALDYFDWDQFGDKVLIIPPEATKRECLEMSLKWLMPFVEKYLTDYSDAEQRILLFRQAANQVLRKPDE